MGFPHGHWTTTTVIAGLTRRGMMAPFVLGGAINRDAFEVYVERGVLVPELRPGDIVIPRAPWARVPSGDRIDSSGID